MMVSGGMARAFAKYRVNCLSQEIEAKTADRSGASLSPSPGGFSAPFRIAFNFPE